MSDKQKLLQEAESAYAELRQGATGLDEGRMSQPWLGTWGVREILIHVSGWHREMTPALERVGRDAPPYPEGVSYDDFDAWNARFVEARRGVKGTELLAEMDASHKAFVAAAAVLPEELFASDGAARALFDGTGPAHYREHGDQIKAWRAQQKA